MKSRFDTRLQYIPRLELTLCIKKLNMFIKHINAESMIDYDVNVFRSF